MNSSILEGLNISLLNIDHKKVDENWHYIDVISPFTRIFFITKGNAVIYFNNRPIELIPNNIYLIPSFSHCSYKCDSSMELYYIHLILDLTNGINFFEEFEVKNEIVADDSTSSAFKVLHELHPHKKLPHNHPNKYQPLTWIQKAKIRELQPSTFLQTQGLLMQILSRFIIGFQRQTMHSHNKYSAIKECIQMINSSSNMAISVNELSKSACLSPDHFSRVFKQVSGVSPQEYISSKKLERAIMLLNNTTNSIESISEMVGFENTQNFTRFFKKRTNSAPGKYRQKNKSNSI